MTEETQVQDLVYALAASPDFAQDGICFAARPSGLYRSDDGGRTWRFTYDSLNLTQPLAATAVVVSPDFPSDQSVFAGAPGGILHSVDGGQTWYVVMLTSPPPLVSALVVSPNFTQDGMLLAGTMEDGVFRSSDRGSHWYPWNFGLLDLNILSMSISLNFADDETLFVGAETGVFRSTNGGRAWREVAFPSEAAPVISLALSPDYTHDGTLFAGTESNGLFVSNDKGRTWTRLGEEAIADAVNGIVLSPQFPTKPHILALLNDTLLVSRDGGKSWSDWKPGLSVEQGTASIIAPQGLDAGVPLLIGLVEGGVLRV